MIPAAFTSAVSPPNERWAASMMAAGACGCHHVHHQRLTPSVFGTDRLCQLLERRQLASHRQHSRTVASHPKSRGPPNPARRPSYDDSLHHAPGL